MSEQPLEKSLSEKPVRPTTGDEVKTSKDIDQHSLLSEIATDLMHFGKGVATGLALNGYNSIEQTSNRLGAHLPEVHFSDQHDVDHSIAGQVGTVIGSTVDFMVINSLVSRSGISQTLSLSTSAAIQSALLTPEPTADVSNSKFFSDKMIAGISSFAGMMATSATANALGNGLRSNRIPFKFNDLAVSSTSYAIGGAFGGAVSSEGQSLMTDYKFAASDSLEKQVLKTALFGGTFGALSAGLGRVTGEGKVAPFSDTIKITGTSKPSYLRANGLLQIEAPVSRNFVKSVADNVGSLPEPVINLLKNNKVTIALVDRLTQSFPELKTQQPTGWNQASFENCSNLYADELKLIATAEHYRNHYANGKLVKSVMEGGLQRHEVGHAVEAALGFAAKEPPFQTAYTLDVARMSPETRARLDYYIQQDEPWQGARETWADLFADLHGGPSFPGLSGDLQKNFPLSRNAVSNSVAAIAH